MVDTTLKHLIIGAGFVGLGMAQALKANREVMKNGKLLRVEIAYFL